MRDAREIARAGQDPTATAVMARIRLLQGPRFLNYPGLSIRLSGSALAAIEEALDIRKDDRGNLYAVPKKKAADALERFDRPTTKKEIN